MAFVNTSLTQWAHQMDDSGLQIAWKLAHQASDPATLEAREAVRAEAEKRGVRLVVVCKHCGHEIEHESNVGWVTTLSGDEGGTYDKCEGKWDSHAQEYGNHEPKS